MTPANERPLTPVIVSASRATDIPAFYSDWFFHRLGEGFVSWKNPFNGVWSRVSFEKTRLVVFWSKNPKPLVGKLRRLDDMGINYYIQFTLNDYDAEKLEPRVPNVQSRIDTFLELSEKIGKEKVIWRFDPLIMTGKNGVDELLDKVANIGGKLKGRTEKLVFSFADIGIYKKVRRNLADNHVEYREFDEKAMCEFAEGLRCLNENWGFELATCSEKIPLENYGIKHNKCVDDDLMIKLFPHDKRLMNYLGVEIREPDMFNPDAATVVKKRDNKDKGQREFCGCVSSKDIGEYNTCPHLCEYCYANASRETALANWESHLSNPFKDSIK